MKALRILVPLLVVAGVVAVAVVLLKPDGSAQATAPLALAPGAAEPAQGPSSLAPAPVMSGSSTIESDRREEARTLAEGSAARQALEVRVSMPAEAPADPELAVVAVPLAESLDEDERRELFGRLRKNEDGAVRDGAVRARVDATGRAQLELPVLAKEDADEDDGYELYLDGRFLFASEVVEVEGDASSAELEAKLGACLVVEVASAPPGATLDGELMLIGGNFGGRGGWSQFDRPALEGRSTFRALDTEKTWMLMPDLDSIHADASMGIELEPGEERQLRVQPTVGATVRGTVVDGSGAPLAEVEISTVDAMPWMRGIGGRETTTDAEGRFELRGLAPGDQLLEAELEGWRSTRSDDLTLAEGQELDGLLLALDQGEAIEGVVLWPGGKPARDARVVVEARRTGGGWGGWGGARRQRVGSTRTDADGSFRVSGLAEGAFTVRASRSSQGGVDDDEDNAPLWRADEAGVQSGTTSLVLELTGPETFAGRVVDERGEPVTSFEIVVRSTEDGGPREEEQYEDEEGRFVFSRVGAGDWTVSVEADGYVHSEGTTVTLPNADNEIELTVERTARVTGRVIDTSGRPMPGSTVIADDGSSSGNPWRGPRGERTETDGEGRFELEDLSPGGLSLTARAEGWADSEAVAMEVAPGEGREEITLVLRVGGRIEGAVLTPEGDPVADQRVAWGSNAMGFGSRDETRTDSAGRFAFEHVTPGDWAVSAAPSMAEMSERMRGRRDQSAWTEVMGQLVTETVTVVDGETVEVFLGGEPRQPVRVFGRVTLAGDPVADATVVAVSEGSAVFQGMKSVQSDEDGSYELVVDRPGPHVVSARSANLGVEAVVEIPRLEEMQVDLQIPLGRIEGVVRKPGGRPAAGIRLSIQREDGLGRMRWGGDQTTTDDSGAYSIDALQAGRYTVRANTSSWGGRADEEWGMVVLDGIEVDADETVSGVDFRLERAGIVEGVVVGPSGEPVDGASLFFRDAGGNVVARVSGTVTNAAGEFRQEGLAPGEYTVTARSAGYASSGDLRVAVASDEATEARVELEAAMTMLVSLEEGELEQRARFEVFDQDGADVGQMMTMQDMQAIFNEGSSGLSQKIGPLAAGRYTVRATTTDGRTTEKRVTLRSRDGQKRVRLKLD